MPRSKRRQVDPTGQNPRRQTAERLSNARIRSARTGVIELIRGLRTIVREDAVVNNNEFHDYQLTQTELDDLIRTVGLEVTRALDTTDQVKPNDWYLDQVIETPYRQGVLETTRDLNQDINLAIIAGITFAGFAPQELSPENILFSEKYRAGIARRQSAVYASVKELGDKLTGQALQRINTGIDSGLSPEFIVNEVADRFDVAESGAKRITDTQVNTAYNNAKLSATRLVGELAGYPSAVLHISALATTTRDHHAARHGMTYTIGDQLEWWDSNANRINCKCSIRAVLLNEDGQIINERFEKALQDER